MRTKRVEGVQRIRVVSMDPRPEVYVNYDGLVGLSERPILKDLLDEIERGNVQMATDPTSKEAPAPITKKVFLTVLKKKGAGRVFVYFDDYVSYGAGAGEEVAEFFFSSMSLLHKPASSGGADKEKLILIHAPGVSEEVEITQ
jgi:hypothetical protein